MAMRKIIGSALIGAPILYKTTGDVLHNLGVNDWRFTALLATWFIVGLLLDIYTGRINTAGLEATN